MQGNAIKYRDLDSGIRWRKKTTLEFKYRKIHIISYKVDHGTLRRNKQTQYVTCHTPWEKKKSSASYKVSYFHMSI